MEEAWGPCLLLFLDPQSGMMPLGSTKSKVKDSFCTCAHPELTADFQCGRTRSSKDREDIGHWRTLVVLLRFPDRIF